MAEVDRARTARSPDLSAVAIGAGAGLALALPAAVGAQVFAGDDGPSGVVTVVVLAAMAVGAIIAGRTATARTRRAPLATAATAAIAVYVVVQAVAIGRLLVDGDEVTWAAVPFFGLVAAALGVTGAVSQPGDATVDD